jgi:hypothetical protein
MWPEGPGIANSCRGVDTGKSNTPGEYDASGSCDNARAYGVARMVSVIEHPQLSLFSERLPRKPYCTDDLGFGLKILPAQAALEKKYVQYNPPALISWLAYDIDRPYVGFGQDFETVAPPNIVVISPTSGHAHYLYGIAAGVSTTSAARDKPRRLLEAIDEGYRHALGGDPGFSQLICKNPLNDYWRVEMLREDLYDLHELAEYVDLDAAVKRIRKTPRTHRKGIGRNCSLFDSLRTWAYKWVGDYRTVGLERWSAVVLAKAEKLNTFTDPLTLSEVRATARSVARWSFNRYEGKMTPSSLAADGLTPESFSLLQSNLGKMAMTKRWGDNSERRAEAVALRMQGLKQLEIARKLGVSQKTISKWLAT